MFGVVIGEGWMYIDFEILFVGVFDGFDIEEDKGVCNCNY